MLSHLFPKCPVLPVDATVSLAQYTRTIQATLDSATVLLRSATASSAERAALLHIRILQLVCKTLPAHPDHGLPETAAARAALAEKADICFARLEAYAASLSKSAAPPPAQRPQLRAPESVVGGRGRDDALPTAAPAAPAPQHSSAAAPQHSSAAAPRQWPGASPKRPRCSVVVPAPLLALFERGSEPIAALGGVCHGEDVMHVTALVLPAQNGPRNGVGEGDVLYPGDVFALLQAKKLVPMGWLRACEEGAAGDAVGEGGKRLQKAVEIVEGGAVTGIVERAIDGGGARLGWFVSEGSAGAEVRPANGANGDGRESRFAPVVGMRQVQYVTVKSEASGAPPFKFYDLRPMAAIHEARQKKLMGITKQTSDDGAESDAMGRS